LVEHGLGIAHATLGRAGDDLCRDRIERDFLLLGDGQQVFGRDFTWAGGSSSVLSRALKAAVLSMCTSSIR
jgi:hypothetical protein